MLQLMVCFVHNSEPKLEQVLNKPGPKIETPADAWDYAVVM